MFARSVPPGGYLKVFRDMTSCSLVKICQCLGGTYSHIFYAKGTGSSCWTEKVNNFLTAASLHCTEI
jgi:hypothetical protein